MVLKKRGIIVFLLCLGCIDIIAAAVLANRSVEQTTTEPTYSEDLKKNTSLCWTDDVTYNDRDIVPGAGPCEQCICNAPEIVCSMIKCEVKTGCKIIQQANQCCPDYKCDCEYGGRTFDNGAKIDTPDTPCRVCYCKGGDVMCTTVGCYERDDCGGKIVPGTCCPKYDHCPPLDPDNPKNRIKLTTADTVTIRNGKYGSQPWLLTTNSVHTANAISDLTTVREEPDYITETNPPSDKMITMVLKRFNNSELTSSSSTSIPSPTDTLNEPKKGTVSSNSSTDFNNSAGASAAKEAINTIKVSSTATLNGTTSSSREIIEARTESIASSMLDKSDSSLSEESSDENLTERSISATASSRGESSNKREEMSNTEVNEVGTENYKAAVDSFSTSKISETNSVKSSTSTAPTVNVEKVASQNNSSRNISKSSSSSELVQGALVTIQTTVTQIKNLSANPIENSENAEILFVEKGSNLSSILNGVTTSFDDDRSSQTENDATMLSDDKISTESTIIEIGSHKNLSLFVDLRRLNGTKVMNDLDTVSAVEATTAIENEERQEKANQTNSNTENLEQNASTTTMFVNASKVEIFTTPVSNASRENITTLAASVTDIERTTPSTNVTKGMVKNSGVDSAGTKMTQAFPFTYGQLTSPTSANNYTECSMGIVKRTSLVSDKSNSLTTIVPVSDFTNSVSINSVTTEEGGFSSIPDSNSTEKFALEMTSNITSSPPIQNASIITDSFQLPDSSVTTKQPADLYKASALNGTENIISNSIPTTNSTPTVTSITPDSSQASSSTPVHLSSSIPDDNLTYSTFSASSAILSSNKTSEKEKTYLLLMSQKYKMEPVQLINSVNAVYLGPGVSYHETLWNHTENVTTISPVKPLTTSHNENSSQLEASKSTSLPRLNSSVSAYKILLDGKVKPLTRPPNSTMAPLSWLKGSAPSNIVQIVDSVSTSVKPGPALQTTRVNSTASTSKSLPSAPTTLSSTLNFSTPRPLQVTTTQRSNVTTTITKPTLNTFGARTNASTTPARSVFLTSSVSHGSATTTKLAPVVTEPSVLANETIITSVNATIAESSSLKNESRQEPAQAKVYDPLMPYPEEYPEEYQTIQNGPAIIITRTTYTRIPDVTYTTVTMATLPTYAQVQKAEENFASTLFDRKFGERSYERSDASGNSDKSSDNQSYFNIDVKKIDEKPGGSKTGKNERDVENSNNQKFVIVQSQPILKEDEDVHILDEKDIKIVENFMNKNLRL